MKYINQIYLSTCLIIILLVITLPGHSPPVYANSHPEMLYELALIGIQPSIRVLPSVEEKGQEERSMLVDEEELDLLMRIIHAEAEGEPYMGMVAVGAVVLNRVRSPIFPNSIPGVVYEGNQFEPVRDGRINLSIDSPAKKAALAALRGEDPTHGALYFYNRDTVIRRGSYDLIEWFDTNTTFLTKIGNHTFTR